MNLNYNQVKELLPQKYPFIFIDKVIDFEHEKSVTCIKNLTGNESLFQGHFPEEAVFPGVLITEAMAQSAILLSKMSSKDKDGQKYMLAGVKSRFLQPAYPGDQIRIETDLVRKTGNGGIVNSSAWVNDVKIATASLTFSISVQFKER
ncbi:3-hydroxyacyl-ACP dehydratase FabZ [Salibacterium sp. K-3]